MKKMSCISLRAICIALAILVLLVLPMTAMAGGGEIKIDPNLLKKLLNKQTLKSSSMKPSVSLFTFNVPVNIQKVHKDVEKAYVACGVSDNVLGPLASHSGSGFTEVPLNNGAYNGNVTVHITSMDMGDPAGVSYYFCALVFQIKGGAMLFPESQLANAQYGPAPNTNFTPIVGGELFP